METIPTTASNGNSSCENVHEQLLSLLGELTDKLTPAPAPKPEKVKVGQIECLAPFSELREAMPRTPWAIMWSSARMSLSRPWQHRNPAKGQAMNSGQIREAVEAIQWQSDGLLQVLYNAVGLEDDKLRTLSAGLSLIALAAGQVHKALAPENSPQ